MKLLAIETTGARASVALIDEAGLCEVQGSDETMNHLQHLIPMIQQLLTKCALSINDVTGILVSEGPGSFTGIRIGMATAKGLAQALNVPILGVPTLRSFAYHMEREDVIACPVFDARRDQVYAGAYGWERPQGGSDCGQAVQLVEDGAYDPKVFLQKVEEAMSSRKEPEQGEAKLLFFGDGLDRYEDAIRGWAQEAVDRGIEVEFAPKQRRYQEALSVAKLGRKLFLEGKQTPLGQMEPVYLRQAEAQRKLEEKMGKTV